MKKKKRFTIGMSIVICMFLVACGESQTGSSPEVISFQPVGEEITRQPSDNEENLMSDNAQSTKEDETENKSDEVQPLEKREILDNKDNENVGGSESQEHNTEKQGDSEESEQFQKTEKISGSIESIEDSGFMLAKTLTMKAENGGDIAVDTLIEDDKQIIHITYNDSTEFVVCTVVDGINGQYTNGLASNLEIGKSVELEGVYGDSGFIAQKVTIYVIG